MPAMYFFLLLCSFSSVFAASPLAGVNIAGFDFGADIMGMAQLASAQGPLKSLGGSDGAGQMLHFVNDDNLNVFRLPVTWQFLINSLTLSGGNSTNGGSNMTMPGNGTAPGNGTRSNAAAGTLDTTNFGKYDQLVRTCLATGAKCIIDVHNYARFQGKIIGQGGPTNDQFANLWSQIAKQYSNETNVVFGIMNEPHNIPDMAIWAKTVQAAVTAIRQAGATSQMILLPGNDFTSAQTFVSNGSAGNLSTVHNPDGSNTSLIFDVHKYLDSDGSGTQLECVSDHVTDTFTPLAAFLKAQGRMAILSETGGGNSSSCVTDLCATLTFINSNTDVYMGYVGWAAGGFSPTDYNLTMTPMGSNGSFMDQEIVQKCVVGTRSGTSGNSTAGPAKAFKAGAPSLLTHGKGLVAVASLSLAFAFLI